MPFNRRFLTPNDAPAGTRCIQLIVPFGDEWESLIRGALVELLDPENFEQLGAYTPEETAAVFEEAIAVTMAWVAC